MAWNVTFSYKSSSTSPDGAHKMFHSTVILSDVSF